MGYYNFDYIDADLFVCLFGNKTLQQKCYLFHNFSDVIKIF